MPPRRRKRTRNWTYFYRNAINAEFAATAEMIDSQANYLGRSHIWLATGIAYRAVRIAGAGSSGLITLFEKVRTNVGTRRRRADGNIVPNAPDRFIVKQVGTRNSAHLKEESNVMLTLQDPKAFWRTQEPGGMGEHFVQVYKSFARELGTDSVDGVDPAGIVGRLYMEYCEDGDMWRSALSATRGVVDPPWPIPEEYIWRAFECLGNAAWMLDIEDIIHFDLKPNNILVARQDKNHPRLPLMKVCDFGNSLIEPLNTRSALWLSNAEWRGSPGFLAPEQTDRTHANRTIGTPVNIWGIGTIIHWLMANGNYTFQDVQVLANGTVSVTQNTFAITPNSHPELGLTPFRACGSKIFEPPYYSNHLIELVHRCLAWDPADRPTPEQVMAIVNPIITGYGDRTPIQLDNNSPNVAPAGHAARTAADNIPAFTANNGTHWPKIPLHANFVTPDVDATVMPSVVFENYVRPP